MDSDKIMSFVKENKIVSLIGAIFLVAIVLLAMLTGPRSVPYMSNADIGAPSYMYETDGMMKSGVYMEQRAETSSSGGSYVEVKEGSMTIKTENAESDASGIRGLAESSAGYVEDLRKYENDYNLNINMRVRIPSTDFEGFVDTLKDRYDEEGFSVSFYRLSTEREIGELEILETAFTNYEELRNRTMLIPLDEKQINLLFEITEKELEIKGLERRYSSSLSGKEERSDYSTLNVVLQEKKEISIMPEDLGDELRLKIKRALDEIANSLMDIVTGSIVVFVSTIKYVIYFIVIAIPLILGFRVMKWIYKKISKGWQSEKIKIMPPA
ncbi:MAG: DUF4349 domain-containing protein [archaeon]|nr:DUF4349 domain-containing protein [archaeon]